MVSAYAMPIMRNWTIDDMPELTGKTALLTGADGGLGLVIARALAARGARVVLASRTLALARTAMAQVHAETPDAKLDYLELELTDLASIRAAADTFLTRHDRLDILCNNAGVLGLPYGTTTDGFETVFGINHLGHFALTGLLIEALRASPGARVVTTSSLAQRHGRLPLEDLNWQHRRYTKGGAYSQSKLANLIFALELDRRLRRNSVDAISVAAHPGYSATGIFYAGDSGARGPLRQLWNLLARMGGRILAQPPERGALSILYAATANDVTGGGFYGPGGLLEFRGPPAPAAMNPLARDDTLATGLWQRSEAMTGVAWL